MKRPSQVTARRRWGVPLVALALVAAYPLALRWSPAFRSFTVQGLVALGLMTPPYQPRTRAMIERNGRLYLWGGPNETDHFEVTESRIDPAKVYHGLGREHFEALIDPRLVRLGETDTWKGEMPMTLSSSDEDVGLPTMRPALLRDDERVLAVAVGDEARIYPLRFLRRHEVVNDVVGDIPVFAAYCYLADLGAVFDRRLGAHVLTFAVSGYTYADPEVWDGRNAFILWDRETESLWWPPLGRSMSGPLMDTPMRVLDEALWMQTTWGVARRALPHALVLDRAQPFAPPAAWPRLVVPAPDAGTPGAASRPDPAPSIPPRWPDNGALDLDAR